MPKLDLTVSNGAVPPDALRELPERLAEVTLRWEGAPDTGFTRSITWVQVHELGAGRFIDGAGGSVAHVVLELTVPAGVLSERRKAGFIADSTEVIRAAAGMRDARAVWVLIHEMPEGTWGAGGEVVRVESLRAAVTKSAERVAAAG